MIAQARQAARFRLGQIVITRNAMESLPAAEVKEAILKHARGDWGVVCKEDAQANEEALSGEGRVFSAYVASNGKRFWVITEWDRSATTVLLPEDY